MNNNNAAEEPRIGREAKDRKRLHRLTVKTWQQQQQLRTCSDGVGVWPLSREKMNVG